MNTGNNCFVCNADFNSIQTLTCTLCKDDSLYEIDFVDSIFDKVCNACCDLIIDWRARLVHYKRADTRELFLSYVLANNDDVPE